MIENRKRPDFPQAAHPSGRSDGRTSFSIWKARRCICALIVFGLITSFWCSIELSRWQEDRAEQAMLSIGARVERQQLSAWIPERYGRRVVALSLTDANAQWQVLMEDFVKSCPCLRTISLVDSEVVDAECGLLVAMSPERLEFEHCTLTAKCWPILRQSKTQVLSLRFVKQLNDAAIRDVARMPRLKSLDLSGTPITDYGIKQLALAPPASLEELVLVGTSIGDEGVKAIAQIRSLRRLDLSDTLITDEAMVALSQLPQLEAITMNWNNISGRRLDALTSCKALRELSLSKTEIGGGRRLPPPIVQQELDIASLLDESRHVDAQGELFFIGCEQRSKRQQVHSTTVLSWFGFDLRGMPSLPHLERLDLSGLDFHDQQALRRLLLCPKLQYLNLCDTNIDLDGVAAIRGAASLQNLRLCNTRIDDSILPYLTQFPNLRIVSLNGSKVTERGLQFFTHPRLEVYRDN